jgi:signal peptidase
VKRWKLIGLLMGALIVIGAFGIASSGALPYRMFVVHTGSMEPTLHSTSAVIVRVGDYHVGQPIAFHEQGGVITHRLVRVNADGTIDTKGDANATEDPWHVPASAIIGEVVANPPALGYWLIYFRNPLGLASTLLAVIVCWQIWGLANATSPGSSGREPAAIRRHAHSVPKHA